MEWLKLGEPGCPFNDDPSWLMDNQIVYKISIRKLNLKENF